MRQTTRRNSSGLILFCGAALQLTLLIANAIKDAVGVRLNELSMTSERIFSALTTPGQP